MHGENGINFNCKTAIFYTPNQKDIKDSPLH